MRNQITNKLRAAYPCLYVVSHEEQRVEAEVRAITKALNYTFLHWSVTTGLIKAPGGGAPAELIAETDDYLAMLDAFLAHRVNDQGEIEGTRVPNKSVVLLRDFHLHLGEPDAMLIRKLKDAFQLAKNSNRHLIILGCALRLPAELEKEIAAVEYKLPDREQLLVVLESTAVSAGIKLSGNLEEILNAAAGLTT